MSNQELQCPFCSKTSSRGTGLASHIRGAHPKQYSGWSRSRKDVQKIEVSNASLKPLDREILEAAILGYQAQIGRIEDKIAGIKQQLSGSSRPTIAAEAGRGEGVAEPSVPTATGRRAGRKSRMTPEGRERLVAALKRRWAAKKAAGAGSATTKNAGGKRGRPKKGA
jgi:hypothetical protein